MIIFLMFVILITSFIISGSIIISENKDIFSKNSIEDTKVNIQYFSEGLRDALVLSGKGEKANDVLVWRAFERVRKMRDIDYAVLFGENKKVILHSIEFSQQTFDQKYKVRRLFSL